MKLSDEQRAAVERTGQDVCCAAGPGSGKTRVLVERFAWLAAQGTSPEKILAITFTEKAATEIKERLAKRFREHATLREAVERAPVSTVHSFCARLLREHALEADLDPGFRVLDELEAGSLAYEAMSEALDAWALQRTGAFRALIEAWGCYEPASHLLAVYESLRMGGGLETALAQWRTFDAAGALEEMARAAEELARNATRTTKSREEKIRQVERWLADRGRMEPLAWVRSFEIGLRGLAEPDAARGRRLRELQQETIRILAGAVNEQHRQALRGILLEFDAAYRRRKREAAGLDFHDLEECALALLEDRAARQEIQERYEAILMDELQDTNPIQWRILECLRRPGRFFAVGDVNQSIYGFRHAAPALFEQYQRDLEASGGVADRLETNYRSRPGILEAASLVAARCEGLREHRLIPREEPFPPIEGPCVEVLRFEPGEAESPGSEEEWIAWRLEELAREITVDDPPRPPRWSDMAVLARTAAPFAALESALAARGIPATVRRGRNFFEQQEVIDLTNLLRFLASPGHEIAVYALLRSPLFAIPDQEIFAARLRGEFPPAAAAEVLERLLAAREELPPDRLIARFLDERGYLERQPAAVRANTDKFLDLLRQWHAAKPGAWRAWLRDLELLRESGREPLAPVLEEEDAVSLMTIHGAKGLEFPIVAIAGIQRGARNTTDPLAWSAAEGLGAAWRLPGDVKAKPDAALEAIRQAEQDRERTESHRLLYVAMTRAQERLILSWTKPGSGAPDWVAKIEQAFGLNWEDAPAGRDEGLVRVRRLAGQPPAPGPAAASGSLPSADVLIVPGEPEPEPAPEVSVTALAHFAECPRRHYLAHVARWPEPAVGVSTGARELGTEVHELLAGAPVQQPSAEALALRDSFLASPLGHEMARAARVEREFGFLFELEGTLLRGVIDLWFEAGGAVTLVDYKTGREIAEETLAGYRLQLGFYALALERLHGKRPARAALYLLHQGRAVDVDLDGSLQNQCRAVLRAWQEAERQGEYPLNAGERCGRCPYERSACPGRG